MYMQNPYHVGIFLKGKRKKKKLTQKWVAEDAMIRQATISDFENDPGSTKIETLFKILWSLGFEMHIVEKVKNKDGKNE